VDDDSDVLRAIERDLRSHYRVEYRVIGSDSPTRALELLSQLKLRNDGVAECRSSVHPEGNPIIASNNEGLG